MRYSISEYVRWEDIDAAGIINYQAYLRFFGLAEVELFRHCNLSYKVMFDELGIWLPRVGPPSRSPNKRLSPVARLSEKFGASIILRISETFSAATSNRNRAIAMAKGLASTPATCWIARRASLSEFQ